MKVDMNLDLKDVPGSLLKALEPISSHGGNIISVLHSRGEKDLVDVKIKFSVRDLASLEIIKKALGEDKIHVNDILVEGREYYSKASLAFILVGHVIDSDVRDTIDRINHLGLVSDIDVIMPDPNKKSSVLMHVDVDEKKLPKLFETVDEICEEKDFLLIKSLD